LIRLEWKNWAETRPWAWPHRGETYVSVSESTERVSKDHLKTVGTHQAIQPKHVDRLLMKTARPWGCSAGEIERMEEGCYTEERSLGLKKVENLYKVSNKNLYEQGKQNSREGGLPGGGGGGVHYRMLWGKRLRSRGSHRASEGSLQGLKESTGWKEGVRSERERSGP